MVPFIYRATVYEDALNWRQDHNHKSSYSNSTCSNFLISMFYVSALLWLLLATVLQAGDTNSPKHCPSCVAVPACMQHLAQLKIQKHVQWDMTYTAFRATLILQDQDIRMLFFCIFYLPVAISILCVSRATDLHFPPTSSAKESAAGVVIDTPWPNCPSDLWTCLCRLRSCQHHGDTAELSAK